MLKGAIIGVGKIAQESHLRAYLDSSIRDYAEVVACADPDTRSISEARKLFPWLRFYSSTEELLERERPDFIDICAPPVYHFEIIQKAMKYKIHILCEKPFTSSLVHAEKLYPLLEEYPAVFMPCHQYKYSPVWESFRDYVCEDKEEKQASFAMFNVFRTEADKGLAALNKSWRINPEISGGGILSDTGAHYLYLAYWIWGFPKSVTARTYSLSHKDYRVEDTALVILEYENSVVEINLSWAADKRANSARLINKNGSLVYNGKSLLKNYNGSAIEIPVPDTSDKASYVSLYVSLLKEFISSIKQNAKNENYIDEAFNTVKMLDACYKSAFNNISVELDAE